MVRELYRGRLVSGHWVVIPKPLSFISNLMMGVNVAVDNYQSNKLSQAPGRSREGCREYAPCYMLPVSLAKTLQYFVYPFLFQNWVTYYMLQVARLKLALKL